MVVSRANRRIERAGVNAVRTLLEDSGHIVQEIDGANDFGEDLYVRFTRNGRVTNRVIAVQVKSGLKYRRSVGYSIPVGRHRRTWRDANVPVVGVVFDPDLNALFWANVTAILRDGARPARASLVSVPVSERSVLSAQSVKAFADEMQGFIVRSNMALPRLENRSLRQAVREAIDSGRSTSDGVGDPLPLYESVGYWIDRHPEALLRLQRGLFLFLAIVVGIAEWQPLYRFADRHQDFTSAWSWTFSLYCYFVVSFVSLEYEARSGRSRRSSRLFAYGPWLTYTLAAALPLPSRLAEVLASVQPSVVHYGILLLFVSNVNWVIDRRRRRRSVAEAGHSSPA